MKRLSVFEYPTRVRLAAVVPTTGTDDGLVLFDFFPFLNALNKQLKKQGQKNSHMFIPTKPEVLVPHTK